MRLRSRIQQDFHIYTHPLRHTLYATRAQVPSFAPVNLMQTLDRQQEECAAAREELSSLKAFVGQMQAEFTTQLTVCGTYLSFIVVSKETCSSPALSTCRTLVAHAVH